MTAPELKYGRRNVAKMIREWDALRHAIRAEGTPMVQSALDQVEEHIDYAYRADLAAAQPSREKPEYCDICRGRTFAETSDGRWWCCVECKSLWLRAAVQPVQARETCGKCMGSGYGGHPDSGQLCADCNGSGGVEPQPDPRDEVIARLVEALEDVMKGENWRMGQKFDANSGSFDLSVQSTALAAAKAVQHD